MCTSTLRVGFEQVIATVERLKTATTVIDCKMKVSSSAATSSLITLSNYRCTLFARLLDGKMRKANIYNLYRFRCKK
jgi:hypothetical protein